MRISDWSSDVCSSDLKRGVLNWDVTYYRSTIKGELLQFDIGPDIPASTFNAGRTLHEGVEAALEVQAAEWLKLRQVYAYSNFRFRNSAHFAHNPLPVVPTHAYPAEIPLDSTALPAAPNPDRGPA